MGVNDVTPFRWPWEPVPQSTDDTVRALQRDMAYMVKYTAVMVHSSRPELRRVVNTPRGQIIPRGEVRFGDGTTIEFQDIGMLQPNAEIVTVPDLVRRVMEQVSELGLGLPLP